MSINYIKYAFDEYIEKPLDDKTLCNLDPGFPNGGPRPKSGPRRVQKGPRDYFQRQLLLGLLTNN